MSAIAYTIYDPKTGLAKQTGEAGNKEAYDVMLLGWPGMAIVPSRINPETEKISRGRVVAYTPKPLSRKDKVDLLRRTRDALLAGSDWTQVADAPVDQEAWKAYRKALRDFPKKVVDPDNPIWPEPPT